MESSFGIPALITVTVGVLLTLRHFAAPEVSLAVRLQLALSWTLSLSILALVPADIAATAFGDESARPTLALLWDLSYWITFTLTWFVLPLHQIYEDAGDFTVGARLATSIRENVIFYAVIVAVALLGIVVLTANGAVTLAGVASVSIASATSFGIVAGIFLLGYGLVEVPRSVWRSANIAKRPIAAYRKVGEVASALSDAFSNLKKVVRASETTQEVMPRDHELRWMLRIIAAETPKSADVAPQPGFPPSDGSDADEHEHEYEYDYDEPSDMVALRRQLKRKLRVYRRTAAQYVFAVSAAIRAEAVLNASGLGASGLGDRGCLMTSSEKRFRNPLRPIRQGRFAETMETIEWWWWCRISPVASRGVAVGLAACSVLTAWAETFMWTTQATDGVDVSPFSFMIRASNSSTAMHVAVIVPLGYMCFCAMFSLFRLGMFSFYSLVPGGTDSFSLLLNASLTCRFAAPLSLNFLMMVPSVREMAYRHDSAHTNTVFHEKLANNIPRFARTFNAAFPALVGAYCATLLWKGCLDKIVKSALRRDDSARFTFASEENDDDRDVHVTDGKSIVERERAEMALHVNNSNTTNTSSAHAWRVGRGCPYYVDLGKQVDLGAFAVSGSTVAGDDDAVERRGLLTRREGDSDDVESRAARWERNKERLANAVRRGAAGASSGLTGAGSGSAVGTLDAVFANLGGSGRR
jgi:hypothetical protein